MRPTATSPDASGRNAPLNRRPLATAVCVQPQEGGGGIYTRAYTCACAYTYAHARERAHTHIFTHTHTHAHTHTHTHTVVMKWVLQLLVALDFVHEECRILHRDLKPQNIFLGRHKHTRALTHTHAHNIHKHKQTHLQNKPRAHIYRCTQHTSGGKPLVILNGKLERCKLLWCGCVGGVQARR